MNLERGLENSFWKSLQVIDFDEVMGDELALGIKLFVLGFESFQSFDQITDSLTFFLFG